MAKKKNTYNFTEEKCPTSVDKNSFYGIDIDDEQRDFISAILNPDKLIVFCNAKAGTGKTTCAVGAANLLVQHGLYDKIIYVTAPVQEEKLGFLPGDVNSKIQNYLYPLYDAMKALGINPFTALIQDNIEGQKNGTAYIDAISHVYLRGCNMCKSVIIIDEAANFYVDELKKVLTRISDDCKAIVIGHSGQCDLYKHPENSGFVKYLNHFATQPWAQICTLSVNHRGVISSWADELDG